MSQCLERKIGSIQDSKIWVWLNDETSVCRLSIASKTLHKLVWPNLMILSCRRGPNAALGYEMIQTSHQMAESNTLPRSVTK